MEQHQYVTLGRSGLRVSPLCLGTMTFGTESGWGMAQSDAGALVDFYRDAGGNFYDCANSYAQGSSEIILGNLIAERSMRQRSVIATKFTRSIEPGNPNAVGNGRKNIMDSLEQSLKRLRTDYVDLYWLHSWDMVTPAEEVLDTLETLVKSGKIRYFGLSDVPAWYAARMQTLAERDSRNRIVALQMEYSLVERSIEREHIPAMQEMGMALCSWGATASGFLSGKYSDNGAGLQGDGRLTVGGRQYVRDTERNWQILRVVEKVAKQVGRSPAEVALNWVACQPGTTSVIIGARSLDQLKSNLSATEFTLPPEMCDDLDSVSALPLVHPYLMFSPPMAAGFAGGVTVRPWKPA